MKSSSKKSFIAAARRPSPRMPIAISRDELSGDSSMRNRPFMRKRNVFLSLAGARAPESSSWQTAPRKASSPISALCRSLLFTCVHSGQSLRNMRSASSVRYLRSKCPACIRSTRSPVRGMSYRCRSFIGSSEMHMYL